LYEEEETEERNRAATCNNSTYSTLHPQPHRLSPSRPFPSDTSVSPWIYPTVKHKTQYKISMMGVGNTNPWLATSLLGGILHRANLRRRVQRDFQGFLIRKASRAVSDAASAVLRLVPPLAFIADLGDADTPHPFCIYIRGTSFVPLVDQIGFPNLRRILGYKCSRCVLKQFGPT
jgi:hypothetical protein